MKIIKLIAVMSFFYFIAVSPVHAAFLVQAPKYVGLNSGLVGFWSFDGKDMATTIAFDRSGNNNNGTLTNGPKPAIGKVGQGMDFDGSNDFINMSDPSSGVLDFGSGQSFSASFWFKTGDDATSQSWPGFISKEDPNVTPRVGYGCLLSSDAPSDTNKLSCELWVSGTFDGAVSTAIVNDGQWH